MWSGRETQVCWLQAAWVQILDLPLATCLTWSKTINLLGSHCSHLQNGTSMLVSSLVTSLYLAHSEPRLVLALIICVVLIGPEMETKIKVKRFHLCGPLLLLLLQDSDREELGRREGYSEGGGGSPGPSHWLVGSKAGPRCSSASACPSTWQHGHGGQCHWRPVGSCRDGSRPVCEL